MKETSHHITDYLNYARRNGLRALELLMERLPADEKVRAQEAFNQLQSKKILSRSKKVNRLS